MVFVLEEWESLDQIFVIYNPQLNPSLMEIVMIYWEIQQPIPCYVCHSRCLLSTCQVGLEGFYFISNKLFIYKKNNTLANTLGADSQG